LKPEDKEKEKIFEVKYCNNTKKGKYCKKGIVNTRMINTRKKD
jgi:hypothetical protein